MKYQLIVTFVDTTKGPLQDALRMVNLGFFNTKTDAKLCRDKFGMDNKLDWLDHYDGLTHGEEIFAKHEIIEIKPSVPTAKVPTSFDVEESIEYIWEALHCYREDCISGDEYDELWDDIATAMHWINDTVEEILKDEEEDLDRIHYPKEDR